MQRRYDPEAAVLRLGLNKNDTWAVYDKRYEERITATHRATCRNGDWWRGGTGERTGGAHLGAINLLFCGTEQDRLRAAGNVS